MSHELLAFFGRGRADRAPTVSVLDPSGYRLPLVEAPDGPPAELRAAVRWRVKSLIDFHIDDAVIDLFEIPSHARGGPTRIQRVRCQRRSFRRSAA